MIPVIRKCRKNDVFSVGPNMCYVNYNIPRTLPMNHCEIKKLIKDGNVQCLEEKLLNGEGYKLIGQYSTNPKIKTFLQSVPIYIARIDMLQDSACKGNLRDMEVLLENGNSSRNIYKIPPVKLVCSKDLNGVTVLHKAVYYDFLDIIEWLVKNYPQTVHIKDKTLRIPLHYICSCSNVSRIWDLMLEAGADPNALDINNNTPSYYLEYSENITLPNNFKNDTLEQDIPIKPSNIRIWIHDRNIKQLAKVIWSGFGDKLLTETSKQATVNKFLKAVPYIMGIIKEIHKAVIEDNLALLKKLNREPVPVEILASKDQNGLTPLHKAVGLGRLSIVDYIISKNSKTVNIRDSDGRTPLHYAFIVEPDNITPIYNKLVKAGANENLIDKKGKTPKGDGTKINDIPINLLTILPKAPRIASEFPASWDWNILYEADEKEKSVIKSKPKESETQANLTTSTTKPTNTNGTENINRVQDIDNIENSNNVENVDINNDYVLNSENKKTNNLKLRDENYISLYNQREVQEINDNIDNVDNSNIKESNNPNNKDTNYTTLYTQSELQDINDNIHRSKNEENDDHKNRDTNYTSLNTQTELQDIANIVDLSKNEENNDHKKRDTNYTSLNTQIELEDIDNNFDHKSKDEENHDRKKRDTNYTSSKTQSELQGIDNKIDYIHNSENKENNDPKNINKNYNSSYTKSELQDIEDINNGISKSSSFTLGEVRQAFNNGLLDDMLPLCGPVYRVNGLKDTENVALFDKNETTSRETQEPKNSAHIIVNKGSLDKIADYILDGKHEKLAGIKSDTPAVQDFLDKIPFYVNKIDQIHRYCAIGDLDGLIQVLDRKKFCLARESKSGLGLTPLHTAALYEQLDIFEYLTTKFPETLKLNDFYGRTAMDYAKSMPDNTFLDKLLNIESIFGEFQTDYRTPLNFGKNSVTFKPKEIQKALGYVTEPADEELSDLDMDRSSNNSGKLLSSVISASRFSVEDREYLNKAIGKPLTSGLKDLIKRRPSNPTLFLAEHLTNHYDDPQSDQESGVLQPNVQPQSIPNRDDQPLIVSHLPRPWDIFNSYRPEFKAISRDEFGMSMIHSAASRTHNRNAFFQLLQELDANIGLRDEHYRTPRDIAVSSNIRENVKTIDKFVVHIIARGEYNKVVNLLLEGYNHIIDLDTDKNIFLLSSNRGHSHISAILPSISTFKETRERLHRAIRLGVQNQVEEMLQERDEECVMLAIAKNERSRCSLHIAVLSQNEEIVRFLAENFPATLDVLDNIERTSLHYAMSVDQVEAMSTILIGCGAKRVVKDLKGRQPSYYFMNKFDIRKLLDEEEELRI